MNCRACGGGAFGDVIDLGPMPLVNNLLDSPNGPCLRWPLKVVFCRQCTLAQLTSAPPPRQMFDEYFYFSSQSHTMVEHAAKLVQQFVQPGQRVLEIASNDGYLLSQAKVRGAKVLGIDPARNIAAFANEQGVPTICDYCNIESARRIRGEWGNADIVFANNVLAHVPDPNEIAAGIAILLDEEGVAHVEVPYLLRMIEQHAFDTIYHEHHCYWSLSAMKSLFKRHGLKVINVSIIEIHGGSLHVQLARKGDEVQANRMIEQERQCGIGDDAFYAGFADAVWGLKADLDECLDSFDHVVGYGAAAKGVVLLNTFGLTTDRVEWVADVSPHKQGRHIPGTGQPIVPPAAMIESRPDAAILLPWNIEAEVLRRNQDYLNQGGRFIVPIPQVRVIAGAAASRNRHAHS